MRIKNSIGFFVLLILISLSSCRKNNSAENDQNNQTKIYLLKNLTSNNPTTTACMNFVSSQNLCLVIIDTGIQTCSDSNISTMMNGIQPSSDRTSVILAAFYSCWQKCNLIFNAQQLTCSGSKFSDATAYHTSQKTPTNQASISWGSCMTTCNNGTSDEPNLKGTGATYPNYN